MSFFSTNPSVNDKKYIYHDNTVDLEISFRCKMAAV